MPNEPPAPRADILLVDDRPENLLALEAVLADLGEAQVRASCRVCLSAWPSNSLSADRISGIVGVCPTSPA
jgi:CheY-like chemotaxis protein